MPQLECKCSHIVKDVGLSSMAGHWYNRIQYDLQIFNLHSKTDK